MVGWPARGLPSRWGRIAALLVLGLWLVPGRTAAAPPRTTLHYAPNHNFALDGTFLPAKAGFNLADVSGPNDFRHLRPGNSALIWIGRCNGVDESFVRLMQTFSGVTNLFGFMLMDDPDPRLLAKVSNPSHACPVDNLRAEVDWIHAHFAGAKAVIVLMNMGSASQPSFKDTYEPSNSHVDLFGLAAYPCRTDLGGCDYDIIDRYVGAASEAGISSDHVVPIYQTFGEGDWVAGTGRYIMPDATQETAILSRWHQLVPAPDMDMAYSWGSQRGDRALENSAELQAIFAKHNTTTANELVP
ncbi:hypothetical protein CCS01_15990 [Rhodopila globiformis]|uniref:Uncharacterized protein n=2 Tax=Rhodopila globiformis TaxID=1071 RepID=A0A2S6NC60_RHOGL|nr:hypothetical protein CCS01_15990 [Rhodopila globiformis]